MAVRFDDHCPPRGPFRAVLNGVDVSNDTTEAYAGRSGWVVRWRNPTHRCVCGERLCEYLTRGDVRIEQVHREMAAV